MDRASELELTVYTPESQIRHPGKLLRSMLRSVISSRELSWRLFVRDISAQYRQSLLGVFWAFLPPIVTSLIFILLQSRGVVSFQETGIPYPVYVLVGTILWQIFTESLSAPLRSITAAKPFLVKVNFPREALIVSSFYQVLFGVAVRLVLLVAIFVFFRMQPTWGLLLCPIPIFILILLGMSIGLILTPFGTLYTDVSTSLPILTNILFFITPVVYPFPKSFPFSVLAVLNPVSPPLMAARDLIARGYIANPSPFFIIAGCSIALLFISWIIYRVALPILIERISA